MAEVACCRILCVLSFFDDAYRDSPRRERTDMAVELGVDTGTLSEKTSSSKDLTNDDGPANSCEEPTLPNDGICKREFFPFPYVRLASGFVVPLTVKDIP